MSARSTSFKTTPVKLHSPIENGGATYIVQPRRSLPAAPMEIDRRLPVLFQGTATLTALLLPRPRFQASTRVAQEFGAGHPPHKETRPLKLGGLGGLAPLDKGDGGFGGWTSALICHRNSKGRDARCLVN